MSEPVSVGVVFERFPASVRGALVFRGLDPEPHQVALSEARVVELRAPGRASRSVEVGPVTVDVAPRGEVLVPFDVPFQDLGPGWYAVTAEVVVDGQLRVRGPNAPAGRFAVGWPSGTVRRGALDADLRIKVPGSEGAHVERVECKAESAVVRWRHAPSEDPGFREFDELRVTADGKRLPVIDGTYDHATGRRTTVVYPVLKGHRELGFELDRRNRAGKAAQKGRWSSTLPLA